ncbi:MAG: twin-arginine translocation signal domain-containing protein [Planctomycetota bacterium]
MNNRSLPQSDRRQFIKTAGAASALGAVAVPRVFSGQGSGGEIRVALIGCGGRGTGAAADALHVKSAPTKIVALADVFDHRVAASHHELTQVFRGSPEKVAVPEDQRFVGFDAYRRAMDALRPGDIAIFATPLAFRSWMM